MNVAVLSESPADEAAVRILVDGLLGMQTESIPPPSLRTRGWPSVLSVLPVVLKHLHYHTDAEALVVVVDADDSLPHHQQHELPNGASDECRLCRLRAATVQAQARLRTIPGRPSLKIAIGLAIPAIEAWYRCGLDAQIIEAALIQRRDAGLRALRNELKRQVYGTDHPVGKMAVNCAIREATRLTQNLDQLERLFPNGFGTFAREIRGW